MPRRRARGNETEHRIGDLGILILAGGEATRLPGKLLRSAGDIPMVARVARNMSEAFEADAITDVMISAKATFPAELDRLLTAPIVIDRYARRGPLGGMLTAFPQMHARFVFVVAGDAPFVDTTVVERLCDAYVAGDEALVPSRTAPSQAAPSEVEPLAAIYDRLAFVREGLPILKSGHGSIRAVLERLHARYVTFADDRLFANINTSADYRAAFPRAETPPLLSGHART